MKTRGGFEVSDRDRARVEATINAVADELVPMFRGWVANARKQGWGAGRIGLFVSGVCSTWALSLADEIWDRLDE